LEVLARVGMLPWLREACPPVLLASCRQPALNEGRKNRDPQN